jgi:hypothetical protein
MAGMTVLADLSDRVMELKVISELVAMRSQFAEVLVDGRVRRQG